MLKTILLINGDGRTQIWVCLPPKHFLFLSRVVSEMAHKLGWQGWAGLHVVHGDKGLVGRRMEPLLLCQYQFLKHGGKKKIKQVPSFVQIIEAVTDVRVS